MKVAVVSGANNVDFLRAVGVKEDQIVFIPANADAIPTVQSRADAYAATELTVSELAKGQANVEQVKPFVDPVVKDAPVRNYGGFAFRPEDKELRDAFNAALVEFRKTDDYKKILAKYGLSEQSIAAAAKEGRRSLRRKMTPAGAVRYRAPITMNSGTLQMDMTAYLPMLWQGAVVTMTMTLAALVVGTVLAFSSAFFASRVDQSSRLSRCATRRCFAAPRCWSSFSGSITRCRSSV